MSEAMNALQQVWYALETSPQDSVAFLDKAAAALPQTQSLQRIFEAEAAKLEERQAIKSILNKREDILDQFVRYRQDDQFGDDATRHFREIKLRGEIQQLDETLKRHIPVYENKHREYFMFQGRRYLEKISDDEDVYLT